MPSSAAPLTSQFSAAVTDEQFADCAALRDLQSRKLAAMLHVVRASNPFYKLKLTGHTFTPTDGRLDDLPFTTRAELEQDQSNHPPYGSNLTYALHRYSRYHQTSGSGGKPMRWLDTADSWQWFKKLWSVIFAAADVTAADRILFPFSFGPFVGFWAAFDGAAEMGALCLPAGGLSTEARLRLMLSNDVTVVCCTPTYALRMAEVARQESIDLPKSNVRALIVAGEPGGSIASVRAQIESAWGARVFDHTGMTEIGALSFECAQSRGTGVHVIESEFISELIDPKTLEPLPDGEIGELVLTNLGRWGSPLIRYRTGDLVRMTRGRCACGRWLARLEGGILGRADDMFIVRGNNVFPTAVEAVLRGIPQIAEFRCRIAAGDSALSRVTLEIEPAAGATDHEGLKSKVQSAIQETLSFRPDVVTVPAGALPRFELKAKRFIREG